MTYTMKLNNVAKMLVYYDNAGYDFSSCASAIPDLKDELIEIKDELIKKAGSGTKIGKRRELNMTIQSLRHICYKYANYDPVIEEIPSYSVPVKGVSPFLSLPNELIKEILKQSGETLKVYHACVLLSKSFKVIALQTPDLSKLKKQKLEINKQNLAIQGKNSIFFKFSQVILPLELNLQNSSTHISDLKKLILAQYPYPSIMKVFLDDAVVCCNRFFYKDSDLIRDKHRDIASPSEWILVHSK